MTPAVTADTANIPASTDSTRLRAVRDAAYRIRLRALTMGEAQGQGYIGQALGISDILAATYADQLRLRPTEPQWPERDRFLLSIGHYAIALYAALAEAGIISEEELDTYATDESRLPMSAMASYTPGMEISGGSLGHGLGIGVGMALGLRYQRNQARVFNLLSDGELNEGSTWEAALSAGHHGLGNLIGIVDVNGLQADGAAPQILDTESIEAKWRSFGWHTHRVNGNDLQALLSAFDSLPSPESTTPTVLICDTRIGCGVQLLEEREKAHFMRVDEHEWGIARDQLAERYTR